MTWNTCAISFPLHIPSAKFLMGLFFLGCWWHDSRHDAPMQIHSVLAQQRFAKQADYIRHSGADLILLQEMLSTSMLDSLMLHLADEFDFAYMRCSPRFGAFILWTLFLLLVAFGQCLCIQLLIVLPCSQFSHSLPASWCWLLICPLFTSLVLRWRHSVPAHFLFGDVAGQLVVLRRKSLDFKVVACFPNQSQYRKHISNLQSYIRHLFFFLECLYTVHTYLYICIYIYNILYIIIYIIYIHMHLKKKCVQRHMILLIHAVRTA